VYSAGASFPAFLPPLPNGENVHKQENKTDKFHV
jgi:hypothetical protein